MDEPLRATPPGEQASPAPAGVEAAPPPRLEVRAGVRRGLVGRWARILSAYFTAQGLTQLLSMGAGLLFINFMAVEEYALFTLAFSVISFFHFITDLGSTSSLIHFFHRTAKEGGDFTPYVAAVLSLRRAAFALGAVAVVVAFPLSAHAKGFPLAAALLVTTGILLTVWFQIVSSIRVLALRLDDRYGRSYRAEIVGGGVRLALAVALVALALLPAWLAVLASAAAAAAVAALARPPRRAAPPAAAELRAPRRQVLRYLLPTLPSALYYSIQAPLVVWLAATFGGTRNIAEVGALGRLGMILSLFSGLTGVIFLPRLARITDDGLYRRRYLQFGSLLAAIAMALVAAAWAVPDLFLLLLGEHYAGLHGELLLVVAGAGLTLLGSYAVGVNLARSWNRWQGPAVAALVAAQATLVALLPLGTTAGVLLFGLLSAAVGLALQLAMTAAGFLRPRWVYWS